MRRTDKTRARRLRVAERIADERPAWCWSDLVLWAYHGELGEYRLHDIRDDGGESCRRRTETPGHPSSCYCGQYENGKLLERQEVAS